MNSHTHVARALTFLLLTTPVIAQETGSCSAGPGAAFGVVGYQCANCAYSRQGQRPSFTFMAEPLVLEVRDGSGIRAGDVIEAVNGKPITTSAGSEQFTYPPIGENSITVRRGREHQTIRVTLDDAQWKEACIRYTRVGMGTAAGYGAAAGVGTGSSAGVAGGVGSGASTATATGSGAGTGASAGSGWGSSANIRVRGGTIGSKPIIVVDGVVMEGGSSNTQPAIGARTGKFGFAVACEPSCTAATDVDGALMYTYYKYDVPPQIAAVRTGSPAERAGIRVGDILLRIDGHSIVDADGALALARIDKKESVRLTVRREGKDLEYAVTP
jgi:PDZ domain